MAEPVSLEDLLVGLMERQEQGYGAVEAREMARRLKALAERHQRKASTTDAPDYCSGCFMDWPCPDHVILQGGGKVSA